MRKDDLENSLQAVLATYGRAPSLARLLADIHGAQCETVTDFIRLRTANPARPGPSKKKPIDTTIANAWVARIQTFDGSVQDFNRLIDRLRNDKPSAETMRAIFNEVTDKQDKRITRPKAAEMLSQWYASRAIIKRHDQVARATYNAA
ncbi:MAG: hypothetical protein SGJ21_09800 [Alphaproteobacteria bacterium]|nr:hypothetical protein [Alphaproteobacteria bacterium]